MFIYMGYLWRGAKTKISELPKEVKIFSVLFALLTWISFIKNFQLFWLVHCDIGRGIIDIFGCICACVIVILISKLLSVGRNILVEVWHILEDIVCLNWTPCQGHSKFFRSIG